MSRRSSVLDGARLGYGPTLQQPRGRGPVRTIILGVICLLLVGALALSVSGRHQSSRDGTPTTTGSAGFSIETTPAGVAATTSRFLYAWTLNAADRDNALASVTLTGTKIDAQAAAALSQHRPVGDPVLTAVDDRTEHAAQTLTGGFTVQLQLLPDQAALYGWLISSVQLG